MKFSEIRNNPQELKALTSFDVEMFNKLLPYFEEELEMYFEKYTFNGKLRKNKFSHKGDSHLKSTDEKLFFILYYLKNNPTQASLGLTFEMKQDMCNKWIFLLSEILSKALIKFKPEQNPERISNQLSDKEEYIIDGTERSVQRDAYIQEEFFSGKKKSYHKKSDPN